MPALVTAEANSLLNLVLRNTAYTPPSSLYVALFTTPVSATALGTEVTGGSYVRKQVTFTAAASGSASNAADVAILGMPAVSVVSLAVMSALTGGRHLWYGAVAKTTNAGDTFTIRAGDLVLGFL